MPFEPRQWPDRIKAVEREFHAARFAIDRLVDAARRDVTLLRNKIAPSDITSASDNLEATYIIRLFTEFETALRLYWPTIRNRPTPARTRDLLDSLAATRTQTSPEHTKSASSATPSSTNAKNRRPPFRLRQRENICASFLVPIPKPIFVGGESFRRSTVTRFFRRKDSPPTVLG